MNPGHKNATMETDGIAPAMVSGAAPMPEGPP